MITEDYGFNFWNHPIILSYVNGTGYHDYSIDDLFTLIEGEFILRRHPGGMYCFGISGDSMHFHSIDIERVLLKVYVYQQTGEMWNKKLQEWEK